MKMSDKAKAIGGIFAAIVIIGAAIGIPLCTEKIPVGYEGVQYSMNGGIKDETLSQGWHIVSPTIKVKEFTTSNEQLILSKDKREGSEGDDSFKVATSDDASIAISFQMSYRFKPDKIVDTYKKFKGMDGEDIVNKRVKTVLKSKVSEITTSYSMMDIYSGNRSEINAKITEYLSKDFGANYGIEVLDCSIIDVHPDDKLKTAIDNRVKALQEKQQKQIEQEKVKVEAQTALIQAENDAKVKVTQAKADAEKQKIAAEAEAEANKKISNSITQKLVDYELAQARKEHGWITTQGANAVVTK